MGKHVEEFWRKIEKLTTCRCADCPGCECALNNSSCWESIKQAHAEAQVKDAEACVWEWTGDSWHAECEDREHLVNHGEVVHDFNVCPLCGKKIEVKP